jgi:uracil-DNA glycosylase
MYKAIPRFVRAGSGHGFRSPGLVPRNEAPLTVEFLPRQLTLPALKKAAASCGGCELYVKATQTVFGEGPGSARLVLVGEQPGDGEDRQGRPFVGPAGKILDRALDEAGLSRPAVYVTNAVKHFYFEERGKGRIHKKPLASHVKACRPWLDAELEVVKPEVLVLLGATAAQAVFGPAFRITRDRGKPLTTALARVAIATAHPSSILRAPDSQAREEAFQALVADLRVAAEQLRKRT